MLLALYVKSKEILAKDNFQLFNLSLSNAGQERPELKSEIL